MHSRNHEHVTGMKLPHINDGDGIAILRDYRRRNPPCDDVAEYAGRVVVNRHVNPVEA